MLIVCIFPISDWVRERQIIVSYTNNLMVYYVIEIYFVPRMTSDQEDNNYIPSSCLTTLICFWYAFASIEGRVLLSQEYTYLMVKSVNLLCKKGLKRQKRQYNGGQIKRTK